VHDAELRFPYCSAERAAVVAAAVEREIGEIDGDRSTASISRVDGELTIEIEADDLVALRAGVNTWETLIEVAERTAALGDGEGL